MYIYCFRTWSLGLQLLAIVVAELLVGLVDSQGSYLMEMPGLEMEMVLYVNIRSE